MNKKKIIKQMIDLYNNQDKDSNGGVLYEKFGDYFCFDLRGNSISSFVSLSEELYQANKNIVLKISFDKFFEIIKELVAKNTFSEEQLDKEIDKIENKRHLFITSINGIEDEKLKFLKIEKVFFVNGIYVKQFFKEFNFKYISEIDKNELMEEKLLLAYEANCYDEDYGYKEFINYIERIIDVFYLLHSSTPDSISFSYAKNPIKVARIYCVKENGFSKRIVKEKNTKPFNLDIEDCFKNKQFGRKLFEIVSKDNLSDIEERILRAIHLLRLSVDEIDVGVSFILISSAFEALVRQKKMIQL